MPLEDAIDALLCCVSKNIDLQLLVIIPEKLLGKYK